MIVRGILSPRPLLIAGHQHFQQLSQTTRAASPFFAYHTRHLSSQFFRSQELKIHLPILIFGISFHKMLATRIILPA